MVTTNAIVHGSKDNTLVTSTFGSQLHTLTLVAPPWDMKASELMEVFSCDALLDHAAICMQCMFGCAAGCNASHSATVTVVLSRPYVRGPGQAPGCTPLTLWHRFGRPIYGLLPRCAVACCAASHKYWHGSAAPGSAGMGGSWPSSEGNLPCPASLSLTCMTSWRVSFDWLLSMNTEAVTAVAKDLM
jgi:hypothetical protein